MGKLRVSSFAVSIDGFGAGPDQDLENPLGVGGVALMDWFFPTRTWEHMHGQEPHHTPVFVLTHHSRPPLRMAGGTEFRLGAGEALFAGFGLPDLGYETVKPVTGERATHVYLRRRAT